MSTPIRTDGSYTNTLHDTPEVMTTLTLPGVYSVEVSCPTADVGDEFFVWAVRTGDALRIADIVAQAATGDVGTRLDDVSFDQARPLSPFPVAAADPVDLVVMAVSGSVFRQVNWVAFQV